jgi:predicted nuclease of restriction endonuclease-like RecB superfamily
MLTGTLVRVRFARQRIIPSYIDPAAPEWQEVAERLLTLFRGEDHKTRGELEMDIKETFDSDPQRLVHLGLAKLLEDRCDFEVVSGHPPEQLRELVFRKSAKQRQAAPATVGAPTFQRDGILQEVADGLQITKDAVDQGLFADLKSEQRMVRFDDITADRLLHRYNTALAQAVLLRSIGVTIYVRREPPQRYRQLLRAVKFHRLIADIKQVDPDTYRMQLDGPLSLFTATQKYGLQLALFLPSVLLCKDFELEAELRWGTDRKEKTFKLTSKDGLVSHLPDIGMYVPPELPMFVELFRKKVSDWEIEEETEVQSLGDGFWVPDYRLVQRATGKTVFLEVLGFWRRASAEKHLARLREHAKKPFILAVSEQLKIDDAELENLPAGIHRFKQMPLPDEVVRLAEKT